MNFYNALVSLSVSFLFFAFSVWSEKLDTELEQDTSHWIDPGDMFTYDIHSKSNIQTDQSQVKVNAKQTCDCLPKKEDKSSQRESNCDPVLDKLKICHKEHQRLSDLTKASSCSRRIVTFVNRSVRKLVLKLKKFEERSTEESITISSEVDPKKIKLIDQFVNQFIDQTELNCKRVDEFEDVFYEVIDNMSLIDHSDGSWFLSFFENHGFTCSVIIASSLSLLFAYNFYLMPKYVKLMTTYGLIIFISFVWQWIQLFQAVISEKHYLMSSAPKECIDSKNDQALTFTNIFLSYFKTLDKECKEYYRALMVNPVFEVNPLTAASHALSAALFAPISIFFDQLGKGFSSFYSHFSFSEKIFVSFILSVFLLILLIFLMGYSIHLPFFLGSIVRGPPMPPIDNDLLRTHLSAMHQILPNINDSTERLRQTSHQSRRAIGENCADVSGVISAQDLASNETKSLSRSRSLPSFGLIHK